MDHKDFLKKGTINEIVYEKCSNLLGNSKIIVANQKKNILKMIKKNIANNSSKKIFFGKNYHFKKNEKSFIYRDELGKINLPLPNLLGEFQISNVATAIAAIRALSQFKINKTHLNKAIKKIRSEGRLQYITRGKLRKYVTNDNQILIDGAHNLLAAFEIRKYLKKTHHQKKVIMVL